MINIYFSHKISGGDEKTPVENMEVNCAKARSVAHWISRELNRFMAVNIYVPGGPTEQFVRRAWLKKMLTVPQIMEIDCDIIADSNFVLCYVPEGDELQGGRAEEVRHAAGLGIPYYQFSNPDHAVEFVRAYYKADQELKDKLNTEVML